MVFCIAFLKSCIFIFDQNVNAKSSNRNRNFFFFHSLGNPKGYTFDYLFYASHIHHNNPTNYINELVEIVLKLSMKTVQVHLIIGMTFGCAALQQIQ